jgi:hypothetical protein
MEYPNFLKTDCVNPEQSAPFVKLVPPHTYLFPINFFAYATTSSPSVVFGFVSERYLV